MTYRSSTSLGGCTLLSQYTPLFGNPVAMAIDIPWAPLRATLAFPHFVFALVDAFGGGIVGLLAGHAARDSLTGRGTLLAGEFGAAFLAACAIATGSGLLTFWGWRTLR